MSSLRLRVRLALLTLAACNAACSGPTGTGTSDARIGGTWQYHAATSGTSVVTDGVLVLSVSAGGGISGTLEGNETDAAGRRTSVTGLVSGSVVDTGSADFTVTLVGGRAREHLAALHGDSLVGDWIERQGQGTAVSGRFGAARKSP